MKFSAAIRRDPTMTKGIRLAYERELVRLCKDARTRLESLVSGKALAAADQPVKDPNLVPNAGRVIVDSIVRPGKQITDKYSEQAYRQGKIRGQELLKAGGAKPAEVTPVSDIFFDQRAVQVIQTRNFAALHGITDDMGKRIADTVTDGIIKGAGAREIAKDINDAVGIGINRARTMARTEVIYAHSAAATEQYRKYGISEEEWLAAIDERTCEICSALNGKRAPIGEMECPAHPACRCAKLPVIPSMEVA